MIQSRLKLICLFNISVAALRLNLPKRGKIHDTIINGTRKMCTDRTGFLLRMDVSQASLNAKTSRRHYYRVQIQVVQIWKTIRGKEVIM